MSVTSPPPRESPLTWQEYAALPEETHGEHIDGRLVLTPGPDRFHQRLMRTLANALDAVLPDSHEVNHEWSWKPGADEFRPDVLVHARAEADAGPAARFTGLPRHWIVDPREREVSAYVLDAGAYRLVALLGTHDELPGTGELDLGTATLHLRAGELFGA